MPIYKLSPYCTDYLWGGTRLINEFNIKSNKNPLAEAWVLSAYENKSSFIENGHLKGLSLIDAINNSNYTLVGTNTEKFPLFPVLIKLIDANKDLSIQVHPNNEYAFINENQMGKNEAVYILDATNDAYLYYGLSKEVTKEELKKRIADNTLIEVLNKVNCKKGDVFYVPSGTIHGYGKGILAYEVQQNSNVTYRLYDYNRLDQNGLPRELHLDKALDVADLKPINTSTFNFNSHLVEDDCFTLDLFKGSYIEDMINDTYYSLVVIDGSATLTNDHESIKINKGDSYLISANSKQYKIEGNTKILRVYTK